MENKKLKILNTFGNTFAPKAKEIINMLGDVDYKNVTQEEFLKIIPEYDVVIVSINPVVDKNVIDKGKKLKFIVEPSNTLENIDVQYAESMGIEVVSLRGESEFLDTITGVAELALGLMIDVNRFTPFAFDSVKKGEWLRENYRGHNLYKKTLGIFGMGRLGNMMARFGKALQMNVIFFDPYVEKSNVSGCKKVSFEELLSKSDIISIHAILTKETENMFDESAFKKIKKSTYVINTARGKIIDEKALLSALENNKIAGFATEVLADELEFDGRGFQKNPLVEYSKTHKNVIIVPHIGGVTQESRENTDIFVAEKLKKIIAKKYEIARN